MTAPRLTLEPLPDRYAICRLPAGAPTPAWAHLEEPGALVSITRTSAELSVLVPADRAPDDVRKEAPFRALIVIGPLPFDAVGILADLAAAIAEAGVPLLAISTFDTDIVLVKEPAYELAVAALVDAGHTVRDRD